MTPSFQPGMAAQNPISVRGASDGHPASQANQRTIVACCSPLSFLWNLATTNEGQCNKWRTGYFETGSDLYRLLCPSVCCFMCPLWAIRCIEAGCKRQIHIHVINICTCIQMYIHICIGKDGYTHKEPCGGRFAPKKLCLLNVDIEFFSVSSLIECNSI